MQENGHAKALMSFNFHNVEISRPLAPDATDEDYRRELNKAIQLCEEGVRALQKLKEIKSHFADVLDEYLYVESVSEAVETRILEGGEPPNAAEHAAIARFGRLKAACFEEHSLAWEWEQKLECYGSNDDMPF